MFGTEKEHYILVEKYRPSTLAEYIGNDHFKDALKQYIEEQDVPHLLLFGSAGTGKTTAAKILINSIDCDSLFINASDENSVDTIRNKIKGFASSAGFRPLKIVVLDEADFITPQGQAALRNLMEVFSKTTRFILTANYKERIIDPIVSRTQQFEIIPPSRKEVAVHVAGILKKEKIGFEPSDLALLINAYYPDIRQIIGSVQSYTRNNTLKVEARKLAESDYKTAIMNVLCSAKSSKDKFAEIRQILADSKIRDFAPLFRLLYDKVTDYATNHISETILAIAEGMYKDSMVVDKEINAMALLINVLGINA